MTSESVKNWLIIVLIVMFMTAMGFAGYSGYKLWYSGGNTENIPQEWTPPPEIRIVEKIKRVEVPVEKIVVVEKQVIVEKLNLPDWIKKNANEQVVATAVIEPYDGDMNVASVINTQTGVGTIVTTPVPMSLISLEHKKDIYVRAGYDTHLETQVSLGGRYKFLRVTNIHLGVYGEISNRQSGEAVAGIEISY